MEYYRTEAGVDLSPGCRSMAPILDSWDHHANPNAEWTYDPSRRAFVVVAGKGGIDAGDDVMVSYGRYTDAHLFAKFGFVNGDGSGHTEASIASLHRILDVGMGRQFAYLPFDALDSPRTRYRVTAPALPSPGTDEGDDDEADRWTRRALSDQRRELARYLQFDDGYRECVPPPPFGDEFSRPAGESPAWALKRLKLRIMQHFANDRSRWAVRMPPRDPESRPSAGSDVPITDGVPNFDPSDIPRFDASHVISTCRLIVLTHRDLDGRAGDVLAEVLRNGTAHTFELGRGDDALEARSLGCLVRLMDQMIYRYPNTAREDMDILENAILPGKNDDDDDDDRGGEGATKRNGGGRTGRVKFRSAEWYAAHVRLGELQTYEVLRGVAASGAKAMRRRAEAGGCEAEDVLVRRRPCEVEGGMTRLADDPPP